MFGKKKKGEVGICRLIDEGVFSTAFPLHDVSNSCFRFDLIFSFDSVESV